MKKTVSLILSIMLVMAIAIPAAAISKIAVKSIKLDKTTITLNVGASYTVTTTFTPANTTQKTLGYKSSNAKVVSVSASGKLTAVAVGSATVTVTSTANSAAKATIKVTVSQTASSGLVQGLTGTLTISAARRQFNVSDPSQGGVYTYMHKYYPNFKVTDYERGNEGNTDADLTKLIAAGTPPDIFITTPGDEPGIIGKKLIRPIDDLLKGDKAYANTLTPAATGINTFGGKCYGITWESLPRAWMLNLDLFQQMGIPVPSQDWTVDQMVAINKKLIDKDNGHSGVQDDCPTLLNQFLQAYAVKGYKVVNGKTVSDFANEPGAITAVQKVYDMVYKYQSIFSSAQSKSFGPNWNDYFTRGHAGMVPWSLWGQPFNIDKGVNFFKWTALPPPKGPTGVRGGNGDGIVMAIYPSTTKLDLAWKYIKAVTSKHFCDNAEAINVGNVPPTTNPCGFGADKKVLPTGLPPINVKFVASPANQAALDGFVKAAASMRVVDCNGYGNQPFSSMVSWFYDHVANNKQTPADMLKDYDNWVNNNVYNKAPLW